MADNIGIDWSLSNPNAFAKGWATQQAMSDQLQANQARQAALANPSDTDAALKLAVYDPEAAKSLFGAQAVQREAQARQAASAFVANPNAQTGSTLAGFSPQDFQQVTQTINAMDEGSRARVNDSMGFLGSAAQQLLAVPQAQRAHALQAMAPQLAQHGITGDQIAQYAQQGLSDDQLHGFIGQAVGVQNMIQNAQNQQRIGFEGQNVALRQQELAQTKRFQDWQMQKGEAVQFGTALVNPITGAPIYDPNTGGPPTLADRNNNPGNIRDGAFARGLPGYAGSDGGFAKFGSPEAGAQAQAALLKSYVDRGFDTPAKIAARWAPSSDGNNPGQYAQALAQAAGIGINDKVTPDKFPAIAEAQAKIEGYHGAVGGGGAGGLTKDALQSMADWSIANGGQSPANLRGQAQQVAFNNARAARMQQLGLTMDQVIQRGQDTHAANKVVQSFTSGADSRTVQALNNVTQHLATLGQLADALNNGNYPLVNAIGNAWARQTGQPAPTNFQAAKQIVGGEIVKAITNAGGGQGDREEAQAAINAANSPAQLQGAVQTVKGLLESQLHTLNLKYQVGSGRQDFAKFLTPLARASFGFGGGQQQAANGGGNVIRYDAQGNRLP